MIAIIDGAPRRRDQHELEPVLLRVAHELLAAPELELRRAQRQHNQRKYHDGLNRTSRHPETEECACYSWFIPTQRIPYQHRI